MNEIIKPGIESLVIKFLFFIILIYLIFRLFKGYNRIISDFKKNKIAYLFFIPAFVGIIMVVIFPFFYNILIKIKLHICFLCQPF